MSMTFCNLSCVIVSFFFWPYVSNKRRPTESFGGWKERIISLCANYLDNPHCSLGGRFKACVISFLVFLSFPLDHELVCIVVFKILRLFLDCEFENSSHSIYNITLRKGYHFQDTYLQSGFYH